VIEDAETLDDVRTELLPELILCERPVCPRGADEGDILLCNASRGELLKDQRSEYGGAGRPGHVVEDDHRCLFPRGKILDPRRSDRLQERFTHPVGAERRALLAAHGAILHVPVVGELDLEHVVFVPEQLRQHYLHQNQLLCFLFFTESVS